MAGDDLQKSLERLGRALVADVERWEQSTRARRGEVLNQVQTAIAQKVEDALESAAETREQRRERRRARRAKVRAERRERERAQASLPGGLVMLIIATVCAAIGYREHDLFWMLFVALGLGLGGLRQLSLVVEHKRTLQREAAERKALEPAPPRHEADELCDQLLADLKAAPEVVRTFLVDPERTVASMRQTTRALDERRRQLHAEVEASRIDAVEKQRAELAEKIKTTNDAQARGRLEAALASCDGQLKALHQLRTAAERTESEYVSLLALLRELKARVTLARSTGAAGPQLDELKTSVRRLNDELEAITEAMQGVSEISSSAEDVLARPAERVR